MQTKKTDIVLLLLFLTLSIALFFLVNLYTIAPDRFSGNGNLGLLPMLPAVPVFLLFMAYLVKISRNYFRYRNFGRALPVTIVLLIVLCVWAEYEHLLSLLVQLDGGPDDPDSRIYRFGWLNQYTNGLFFNHYTFTLGVLVSLLIASLWKRVGKRT